MADKLIISATKGRSGLHSTSVCVWTPKEFFNRDFRERELWSMYIYIAEQNSGRSPKLVTKERLKKELYEYCDTDTWQYFMNLRWRR